MIEELARQHTDTAIGTLVEICGNKDVPPAARVAAAGILLDRGWGKPRQPVENSGELTHKYVIRAPSPVEDAQRWIERYAPKDAEPV
jgi:hypothetical protein